MERLGNVRRNYNENIYNSANHLLNIINDILDLAKIEAGRQELVLSLFEMEPIFQETMTLIRPLAQKRNVKLVLDVEGNLPSVKLEAAKIKQILINLMSNAVKFTEAEGTVKLHSKLIEEDGRQLLYIEVADTGCGISVEKLEVIFDEFAQVNESMTRASEGTGLGLALVRRLLEMHGGCVWAESDGMPGKGTAMKILLPLEVSQSTAGADARPACFLIDSQQIGLRDLPAYEECEGIDLMSFQERFDYMKAVMMNRPAAIVFAAEPEAVEENILRLKQLRAIPEAQQIPIALYSEELPDTARAASL